jgi:hypothetical protein
MYSTNKADRPQYNWNIVESGIKHHNPNPPLSMCGPYLVILDYIW